MNKSFVELVNTFLQPIGINFKKVKEQKIQNLYLTFLENLLLNDSGEKIASNEDQNLDVNFIIFSKDRAIQLYALLRSLLFNLVQPARVHVLYFASNSQHSQAYNEVKALVSGHDILFIKENHFRKDLISIVNNLTVSKVIFLVDDIVFTEPLNLNDFINFNTNQYVPSLRMGDHLNFSYTLQKPQPLPEFILKVEGDEKIKWRWQSGILDWNYPLSVDGHLFSVHEIKNMLPLIEFKAPNSLEESMQIFKPFYLKKFGVAYKKSKIVNIPCNKVQDENDNISGEITVDFLLEKWNDGFQIDYTKFLHFKNTSAHQVIPFHFIKRPNCS